jgi:hypothetical protein
MTPVSGRQEADARPVSGPEDLLALIVSNIKD